MQFTKTENIINMNIIFHKDIYKASLNIIVESPQVSGGKKKMSQKPEDVCLGLFCVCANDK
jgi:hypothetical protein